MIQISVIDTTSSLQINLLLSLFCFSNPSSYHPCFTYNPMSLSLGVYSSHSWIFNIHLSTIFPSPSFHLNNHIFSVLLWRCWFLNRPDQLTHLTINIFTHTINSWMCLNTYILSVIMSDFQFTSKLRMKTQYYIGQEGRLNWNTHPIITDSIMKFKRHYKKA